MTGTIFLTTENIKYLAWWGPGSMSKKNWLSKKQKNMISYLCKNTTKSYSQIGDFLGVHKNTVSKYRKYGDL